MKKPFKIAAYSGIAIIILSIISNFINFLIKNNVKSSILIGMSVLIFWINLLFWILFTNGFIALGKKYKSKLLVIISWIGMIFLIVILGVSIIGSIISVIPNATAQANELTNPAIEQILMKIDPNDINSIQNLTIQEQQQLFSFFMIVWVVFSGIIGLYFILAGIGLIKIKEKIKYLRTAAILNIVAGATFIILIGIFIKLASFVFEILMFYNLSKKIEK